MPRKTVLSAIKFTTQLQHFYNEYQQINHHTHKEDRRICKRSFNSFDIYIVGTMYNIIKRRGTDYNDLT